MLINNGVGATPNIINFGYSGNMPSGSGSYYEIDSFGYSTAAFNVQTPSQGTVQFTASFDGVNYDSVTFRQMGDDGYSQEAAETSNYIGSVVGSRKLRFVNASGAFSSGTVMGTLSKEVCVLEGVEHNSPPHKFGNALFHIGINFSGNAFSNSGLYFPQPRHKFAVTYVSLAMASQNGAFITLHEGSGTAANASQWIFTTFTRNSTNDTQLVNAVLSTPYVSSDFQSGLFLSVQGNDAIVRGVVHGYETE